MGGGHSHCLTDEMMRCRVILVYDTFCASNRFWDVVLCCVFIFYCCFFVIFCG